MCHDGRGVTHENYDTPLGEVKCTIQSTKRRLKTKANGCRCYMHSSEVANTGVGVLSFGLPCLRDLPLSGLLYSEIPQIAVLFRDRREGPEDAAKLKGAVDERRGLIFQWDKEEMEEVQARQSSIRSTQEPFKATERAPNSPAKRCRCQYAR